MTNDTLKPNNSLNLLDEFIREQPVAMMCTQEGRLIHGRPMFTLEESSSYKLLFLSTSTSVEENSLISLCYANHESLKYACVQGEVQISRDQENIHKLWKPDFEKWVEGGVSNPQLAVITVVPFVIEVWNNFKNEKVSMRDEKLEEAGRSHDALNEKQNNKKEVHAGDEEDSLEQGSGYSWSTQKVPEQAAKTIHGETDDEAKESRDSAEVRAAILSDEISQG